MTEKAAEATGKWPELGAKSPEKTDKPRSAPREKKADSTGVKDRQGSRDQKPQPVDNGEPLVKPSPVPEPDLKEQEEKDKTLRAEIEADEAKVTELNEAIDKAREERGEHQESMKGIKNELQEMRNKYREVAVERDALVDQLKKHSELKKQQDQKVQRLKKDLKIMDTAGIEKAIADMTTQLETSSMDLKSEKAILYEIKKLNTQKEQLKEWEAEREKVDNMRTAHDELYKKRQDVGEVLTKMREDEKVVATKLEAMRNGEGTKDGIAPNEKVQKLMEEKAQMVEGMKAKRAALKEANGKYRIKMAEYREYTKALEAYERKVGHREYLARKAEQAERNAAIKEERKKRDQERKEERARQEKRFAKVAAGFQMFVGGLALRTTEEELLAHFSQFAEVTDCSIVKDPETRHSRGFGFVTVSSKEKADECIKENSGKELKLCPPHGRLSVKMAAKSKQQAEWEAAQKKAKEAEEEKAKGEAKPEAPKKEAKPEVKEAPKEEEVVVDDGAADDFFGAFGVLETPGKVELPPKVEAPKEEEKKAEPEAEDSKKDKEWKATRTDWVNEGENGHPNGVETAEAPAN